MSTDDKTTTPQEQLELDLGDWRAHWRGRPDGLGPAVAQLDAEADFEDGGSYPYASEFDADEEPTRDYKLTWWQRFKLNAEIKREARAERKAERASTKRLVEYARACAKHRKAREAQPHLAALSDTTLDASALGVGMAHRLDAAKIIRHQLQTRLDRRFKYVATIGSWLTLLACVAMLTMCGACGKPKTVAAPTQPGVAVDERAVIVVTGCIDISTMPPQIDVARVGSGVLINDTMVLTAEHVVRPCEDGKVTTIHVATKGNVLLEVNGAASLGGDVAALKLASPLTNIKPLTLRTEAPRVGESVCSSSVHPNFERRCGFVHSYRAESNGDMRITMPAIAGNSGSGLYNYKGELVGIVVQRHPCEMKFPLIMTSCGGFATSLASVLK